MKATIPRLNDGVEAVIPTDAFIILPIYIVIREKSLKDILPRIIFAEIFLYSLSCAEF